MKKRLILLFAAVLLALPLGANVAMADGGGNSNDVPEDTGNACPPNSPQGDEEDPSCGNEGNGPSDDGNENQGNKGNNGQGPDGGSDADYGNACPPTSPNAGGDPACGTGDDNAPGNGGEGNGGNGDDDDGNDNGDGGNGVAVPQCKTVAENPPPPIVIELPLQPLAYACVILFPETEDKAACPGGAIPVAVPAHPLLDACLVVGPDAADPEAALSL